MQIDSLKDIAVWTFFISGFAILILFIYWNILYLFLTKKYDKSLFREPYFNLSELAVYNVWPLSLVKATAYVLLITNASIAKKRFQSLSEPINETATVKFFCYLLIGLTLIFGGVFVAGLIWGGVDMLLVSSRI